MKHILLLATLVALTLAPTKAQELKFGHFDSSAFLQELPDVKEAQATLEAEAGKIEGQLATLNEDFQKMQNDYQSVAETLSAEDRTARETELSETYQKIQNFVQLSRQQLQAKQREMLAPIMQKLSRIVQEVGMENNFTYIIEQNGNLALYISQSQSVDITPLVKKKYGIN